jgi:glyoxalase family protein
MIASFGTAKIPTRIGRRASIARALESGDGKPAGGARVKLNGLHHITMITADARRNVEFYADTLGLRLVKKTVNFDAPDAYHLYFGDERGAPGSLLTWFEFAGAGRGRPGAGMIHRIELAVTSEDALAFWEARLTEHGYAPAHEGDAVRFTDYEGLAFAITMPGAESPDPPLRAAHPEIPVEHAIAGISGARAYAPADVVDQESPLLTGPLQFTYEGSGNYRLEGSERHFSWGYDPAPVGTGVQGAGTVHHIAWACEDADQIAWRRALQQVGRHVTEVIDRDYFKSIYFREPLHVLFEIATLGPGFAVDESPEHLGEELRLPAQHEHLRARLERMLTPIENPRLARGAIS